MNDDNDDDYNYGRRNVELESRNFFEDFERRSCLFWDISRDKKILLNLKGKTWQLNCEFISNKS